MKNWYKNQKGSMAVYVAVTVLSFMVILTGIFFTAASVRKNQLKTIPKIKEAYEKDLSKKEEIYKQQLASRNLEGGNFNIYKGINTPKLGEGMVPVKWDNNSNAWVVCTANDDTWYSYTQTDKQWANVMLKDGLTVEDISDVDSATLETMAGKKVLTVGSMFVWVPRYSYQIEENYHTTSITGGAINIDFMKGTSTETANGSKIVEYNEVTTENYTKFPDGYVIHPGFEYDKTVSGIWVAKFEASQSDAGANTADYENSTGGTSGIIKIQPGVNSWRNISVNDMYIKCLEYNSTLNSHLMKNTEWGAVAYLTQSSYGKGKNNEVWINPNSNYITGQAGTDSNVEATDTTYDYTNATYGVNASTTGNIYGIYDMSGGAGESLAAYIDNGNSNLETYASSLIAGANYTKNIYVMGTTDTRSNNYIANKERYGDAIYETSSGTYDVDGDSNVQSWYADSTYFPYSSDIGFNRGGYYQQNSNAGLFSFDVSYGTTNENHSFRPVLIIRRRNRSNTGNKINFKSIYSKFNSRKNFNFNSYSNTR